MVIESNNSSLVYQQPHLQRLLLLLSCRVLPDSMTRLEQDGPTSS